MKSDKRDATTFAVEVTRVSSQGFWLSIENREMFIPFEHFPWFKDAPVSSIRKVEMLSEDHLYWTDLDVDLSIESIEHPERFPLVAK
jgi:hypothetical protein